MVSFTWRWKENDLGITTSIISVDVHARLRGEWRIVVSNSRSLVVWTYQCVLLILQVGSVDVVSRGE